MYIQQNGHAEKRAKHRHITFFGLVDMNEAQSETLFQRIIIPIEFEAPMGQDAQQHTDN
jgi:hypothetical protein